MSRLLSVLGANVLMGVMALMMFMSGTAPVDAQDLQLNTQCPSVDDGEYGKLQVAQLQCLCFHSDNACSITPTPAKPVETNAVLTCGQWKEMANQGRINTAFTEGQAAIVIEQQYCNGVPDDQAPQPVKPVSKFPSGQYTFVRGYYTQYTGQKAQTCMPSYSGVASVDGAGNISFKSDKYVWTGVVTPDSFIAITTAGITPQPIHKTTILGPATDAVLYNGYCGEGFFRMTPA